MILSCALYVKEFMIQEESRANSAKLSDDEKNKLHHKNTEDSKITPPQMPLRKHGTVVAHTG